MCLDVAEQVRRALSPVDGGMLLSSGTQSDDAIDGPLFCDAVP